jgi:hypothetical protein
LIAIDETTLAVLIDDTDDGIVGDQHIRGVLFDDNGTARSKGILQCKTKCDIDWCEYGLTATNIICDSDVTGDLFWDEIRL